MKPLPKTLLLITIGLLFAFNLNIDKEVYSNFTILEAQNTSYLIKNQTLASQMTEFDPELYDLAYRIIECESGWDASAQNKMSTAYGLGQVIDGTFLWVQKKWRIELDRDNPEDQMYIVVRLLEEKGYSHWAESAHCWDKEHKYIK